MGSFLKASADYFRKRGKEISILAIILTLNAIVLRFNSFRCFNFYDMSIFIDGGWRIIHGQRPYVDFSYFNGPLQLYMNALFFKILGFGKPALLFHTIVVHSIVIILNFVIARRYLSSALSFLLTLLTTTCFYWSVSLPWHDQTAHLWGIIALALLTRPGWEKKGGISFLTTLGCGLLVLLSWMSKLNIGTAYGVMFFGIFIFSDRRVKALSGYAAGILLGFLVMGFLIPDYQKFFEQITAFSGVMRDRFDSLSDLTHWFINFYWLPLLMVLITTLPEIRKLKRWLSLYLGLTFVCTFSMLTGGIISSASIFLWGIQMTYAFIILEQIKDLPATRRAKKLRSIFRRLLILLTIILICISSYYGERLKIWSYTGNNYLGDYPLKAKPFTGWLFSKNRGEVFDEILAYLKETIPPRDSFLVLSDMTVIYSLIGHESYRHAPVSSFIPNHTPPPGKQLKQFQEALRANPPQWIFTEIPSFITMVPYLGIKQDIANSYQVVKSWGPYAVFKRNN